jgi:hypothetical protein
MLSEGEKNIRLEIVVDGKFYTPLTEQILVETPVRIASKMIGESVRDVIQDNEPVKLSIGALIKKDVLKK